MMPKVSILVLTYNSKKYLDTCFKSLINQTYKNYEIVMVDNNSSDGSVEYVKEKFPQVKIIKLDKNYGYTGAYNRAVKLVKSKYVVFLNPDVEVEPNWLEELVNAIRKYESKGVRVCGSKIIYYYNRDIVQNAGGYITPIGTGLAPEKLQKNRPEREPKYVGYVQGSSMLVDKDFFLKIGGFDEDYFMYLDEIDFCWRTWLFGYKVLYVPTSIVYHIGSADVSMFFSGSSLMVYHSIKNRMANIFKNFSGLNILKAVLLILAFDFLFLIRNLRRGNFEAIMSLFRGYVYFFINFKNILKKRKYIQIRRKLSDSELRMSNILLTLQDCLREYFRLRKIYDKK